MITFSFVIPVYKAEKYLDECISSILMQTYSDYEIILVDDGSPDNSGLLCDSYAKQYSNIYTIHQENGGASAARNTGIRAARGQYIIFLDSDDFWFDKNGLEKVFRETLKNPDMIVFASKDYYENTKEWYDDRYNYDDILNSLSPQECLHYMIGHDRFNVHPGKRAIKRKFILDNELFFKPGIRSEDIEVGIRAANCLPVYRFIDEKIYVYRHHEDSVTTTIGLKHLLEYKSIIETFATWSYANNDVRDALLSYLGYQLGLLIAFINSIKPDGYKKLLKELKQYTYLFKYTLYPRTKIVAVLYRLLGYRITCILLSYYLRRGSK